MATHFFWDPVEDNIVQERDDTGVITAEYATEPYLYGNLISQNRFGVESQYHFDPQGSTLALTDDNQQVTDTYAYSAFGEVTFHTGSTVNPLQFIGRKGYYRDDIMGEYLVRARQLSSQYGRWLSFDPENAMQTLSNVFWYGENNPTNYVDPSGRAFVSFYPTEIDSMAWQSCGNSPAGTYAHTAVCSFEVSCACKQEGCGCHERRLHCCVQMEVGIYINLKKVKDDNVPNGRFGIYAHEQRHVVAWKMFAEQIKVWLDQFESQLGCFSFYDCITKIGEARSSILAQKDEWQLRQKNHYPPAPEDRKFDYPLMGTMPQEPSQYLEYCLDGAPCPPDKSERPRPICKRQGV